MNVPEAAHSSNSIEQRMRNLDRGVRLFGMTFLLLSGAGNLALAWSMKGIAAKLPENVMTSISPFVQSVLAHPDYSLGLAILFPVVGSGITLRAKDPWQAMTALSVYLLLVTAQFVAMTCVLGSPIAEMLGKAGALLTQF